MKLNVYVHKKISDPPSSDVYYTLWHTIIMTGLRQAFKNYLMWHKTTYENTHFYHTLHHYRQYIVYIYYQFNLSRPLNFMVTGPWHIAVFEANLFQPIRLLQCRLTGICTRNTELACNIQLVYSSRKCRSIVKFMTLLHFHGLT